jgi:hypothetical protein
MLVMVNLFLRSDWRTTDAASCRKNFSSNLNPFAPSFKANKLDHYSVMSLMEWKLLPIFWANLGDSAIKMSLAPKFGVLMRDIPPRR